MKDDTRYFTQGQIESISKILGDTEFGLTGTEIGQFLLSCKIADTDPSLTKWKRLNNAFCNEHNKRRNDNFILSFISKSLEPSRFIGNSYQFKVLSGDVNKVLSFIGLEFRDDGTFHTIKSITNLSEAESRAQNLLQLVKDRKLHPELINYCKAELLSDNYFHAVLESVKGLACKIREKTGLTSDGNDLIDSTFCGDAPLLRINSYSTDTEKSEQRGFSNLLKGIFGTFRNPTAHAAKIEWELSEIDAFDIFSIISYSYRRVYNSKSFTER